MKTKSKTANVAEMKNVLSIKAATAKTDKKFNAPDAQTVKAEILEEQKPQDLQESNQTVTAPNAPEQQQEVATVTKAEQKRIPTMQELKESVTTLYLLQEKHSQLIAKRASLNKFAITHQRDNAEIVVTDAKGEEFTSRSPKTIAKLIEFWKVEFDEAIQEVENQLKDIFLGAA